MIFTKIIKPCYFRLNPASPSSFNPATITTYMNIQSRILKFLAIGLSTNLIFFGFPAFAQSPSPKSVQIDPDWEKIRDAQVQMLRKKEAELDRMKEELLTRAQPQAKVQSGLPEIEAEFKKHKVEWSQKNDRYENQITLFKVKIEEQKKQIDSLRLQLNDVFKKQPAGQQGVLSVDQEARLKFQDQQVQEELSRLKKEKIDFQNQIKNWDASKLQAQQKNEAELRQLKTDQLVFESQKAAFAKDKAGLAVETEAYRVKSKELKDVSVQAQTLLKRETDLLSKEQQFNQKQTDMIEREKRIADSQKKWAEEKRLWLNQKSQTDAVLAQKLQDAEARLVKAQDAKQLAELNRQKLEEQVTGLKTQLQESQNQITQQEGKWKKREQDLLSAQTGENSQIAELQTQLAKEKTNLSQKEIQWSSQLDALAQKLVQSETQSKETELRIKDSELKAANQTNSREKEWQDKFLKMDNEKANLIQKDARWKAELDGLSQKLAQSEAQLKETELRRKDGELKAANQTDTREKKWQDKFSKLDNEKSNLIQKDAQWKAQLDGLSQKLVQSEAQLKEAELRLKDGALKAANQIDTRDKEWQSKFSDLEKKKTDLTALETRLKTQSKDLAAQSLQLEEKYKALKQDREQFASQPKVSSAALNKQTDLEVMELKKKLELSERDNENWRQNKRQLEQSWSEFINKEMQYQMQITGLQKENQRLQQHLASASAAQQTLVNPAGRDWSEESRRVVEDRRALADEKNRLYRQLTQDRQSFEQSQVQFSRAQREFEQHIRDEEARLEKMRRQSAQRQ